LYLAMDDDEEIAPIRITKLTIITKTIMFSHTCLL
jgi:hypothetical protein